jgi:uncharacterized lipoprotein
MIRRMKSAQVFLALALALPPLSGCHPFRALSSAACHSVEPYQRERSVPPLVIPAGLDAPDNSNALRLPKLNEPPPPPRTGKQPCLDVPPSFKVQPPPRATPQA